MGRLSFCGCPYNESPLLFRVLFRASVFSRIPKWGFERDSFKVSHDVRLFWLRLDLRAV